MEAEIDKIKNDMKVRTKYNSNFKRYKYTHVEKKIKLQMQKQLTMDRML